MWKETLVIAYRVMRTALEWGIAIWLLRLLLNH